MGDDFSADPPLWRRKAYELFPELWSEFDRADSSYLLWYEVQKAFDGAYDSGDRALIDRVYRYARWCCEQPRGESAADDLLTCVVVSFFEEIPLNEKAINDLPNWFSKAEIESMKETFIYHVGEMGYQGILSRYG